MHRMALRFVMHRKALLIFSLIGVYNRRMPISARNKLRCGSPKRCTRYITTTSFYLA
jgi:hypothetical protein